MSPKFGTSGLRGLVTDLTCDVVQRYVHAFVHACDVGDTVYIGRDLRASSPDIATMVRAALHHAGVTPVDCGTVPTPALALIAAQNRAGAVMVTGSHIPDDRNGLKFYTTQGEITKTDEADILTACGDIIGQDRATPVLQEQEAGCAYIARYVDAFGPALTGLRLGVYSHSSVGRDLLIEILRACGAHVVELGRSATFIPVDTEAVSDAMRASLTRWASDAQFDAILSMDGDGDRPLLTDETGHVIAGDILGQITGHWLGADVAVTPVSSNTGAEVQFEKVLRTRIGSPYVIAGMQETGGRVVGYEANGGFLLGFAARNLSPLMTRDAVLPLIVPLIAAQEAGQGLSGLLARQPARFTAADRIAGIPTDISQRYVAQLDTDVAQRTDFIKAFEGVEAQIDRMDGLRITLEDGRIVHLRPSGNAPELRLYSEGATPAQAQEMVGRGVALLKTRLT